MMSFTTNLCLNLGIVEAEGVRNIGAMIYYNNISILDFTKYMKLLSDDVPPTPRISSYNVK